MDCEPLANIVQRLLTEKKTTFRRISAETLKKFGCCLPFEDAFVLPGSKSTLEHQIFLLINNKEHVSILAYSRKAAKALGEQEALEITALGLSERESWGTWIVCSSEAQAALALKGGVTVGQGDRVEALIWSTCGLVDAAFKSKERDMRMEVVEQSEAQLQGHVKSLLSRVGFRKIKEMTLSRSQKAFLVVLSNESDSVEDCWKRFPMRFEVEKAGIVTLRVFFSVNDKAHTFEKGMYEAAMNISAKLNSHIPEGCYLLDSKSCQVHLIFKLICGKLHDESIRALLQNYYEAAISIYKWSAWSFVQLVQQHPQDKYRLAGPRTAEVEDLMAKGLERSPSERKCILLSYEYDPVQFKQDCECLDLIQRTPALERYLLPEPFVVSPQEMAVKVFEDKLLKPLEEAFGEGMSAGMFIVQSFFTMMKEFATYNFFPSLSMLRFRSSPLRLLLIPCKGFSISAAPTYSAFQSLVIRCCISAEQELTLTPDVSLLYFSPDSLELVESTDTGPKVKGKIAGGMYLLWRLKVPYLTRRIVNYVEGYRAEARRVCGENTVEGIVATEDDRFEVIAGEEEVNRFYLLEQHRYTTIQLSDLRDIKTLRGLMDFLSFLHTQGLFHGLVSPGTVRKTKKGKEWRYFICMPCLHWKYVEVLYPIVPEAYFSYLAPEITMLYRTSQPQDIAILKSCDVYSFARLLLNWFPHVKDYPQIQAAQAVNWGDRPTLEQLMEELEEGLGRSTLSTGGHQECGESEKLLEIS